MQWMDTGGSGRSGLPAVLHVAVVSKREQECAFPRCTEDWNVWETASRPLLVRWSHVQVRLACEMVCSGLDKRWHTVDCQWTDWGNWTQCSVTCNGGTRTRSRQYLVTAQYGGKGCAGEGIQTNTCNTQPCPGEHQLCACKMIIIFAENVPTVII